MIGVCSVLRFFRRNLALVHVGLVEYSFPRLVKTEPTVESHDGKQQIRIDTSTGVLQYQP